MELVVVMTGQEIMVEEELMIFAQVVVYSAVSFHYKSDPTNPSMIPLKEIHNVL